MVAFSFQWVDIPVVIRRSDPTRHLALMDIGTDTAIHVIRILKRVLQNHREYGPQVSRGKMNAIQYVNGVQKK